MMDGKTYLHSLAVAAMMALVAGPLPGAEAQAPADTTAAADSTDAVSFTRPVHSYDAGGKRDPFFSLAPREQAGDEPQIKDLFNYEDAELKGVVRADGDVYALAVDRNRMGYVLREGYRVFGGYVTRITDNAVHLHIVKYGRTMNIIMRLASARTEIVEETAPGTTVVRKPGINITYSDDTAGRRSDVRIDDVTVPSAGVPTLEEQWFGESGGPQATGDEAVEEDATAAGPGAFSLYAPPDGQWITLPYVLNWTDSEGKDVTYSLVISEEPDYGNVLLARDGIEASEFVLTRALNLPPNTRLYWMVTAVDAGGNGTVCRRTDMSFRIKNAQ